MASYELVKNDGGAYYAIGLRDIDPNPEWSKSNTVLLVRYENGDCDTVANNDQKMHEALYDLYQCNDNLKDGDTFTLDGVVVYRCEGVHVVKVD